MKKNKISKAEMKKVKEVFDKLPESTVKLLLEWTYKAGVLSAIFYLELEDSANGTKTSTDKNKIAQKLYEIKGGVIGVDEFLEITEKWLPTLVKEKLIDKDGALTEEGAFIAVHHESLLNEDEGSDSYRPSRGDEFPPDNPWDETNPLEY